MSAAPTTTCWPPTWRCSRRTSLQAFAGDPATLAAYGLPLGIAVDDLGQVVVRTERGVFHLWADGNISALDVLDEARTVGLVPALTSPDAVAAGASGTSAR